MAIIDWTGLHPTGEVATEMEPPQQLLNREAAFSLGDHQLVDPDTRQGFVNRIQQCEPVSMAGETLPDGVEVFEIGVVDPFIAADPEGYAIVRDQVEHLESLIRREGFEPLEERRKEHPYVRDGEIAGGAGNKFTDAWLSGPNLAALKAWHSNVPTAEALGYLTDSNSGSVVFDKEGQPYIASPETAAFLRFVDDAVGIRNRAVAMQKLAEMHLETLGEGAKVRWLSLASGTAEPSIAASQNAVDKYGTDVELVVTDINPTSLKYVLHNAEKYGFDSERITTILANLMNAEDFNDRLRKKTGDQGLYHVVENLGFEEYLPQDGDELGAFKEMGLTQASDFTKMAYDLVEPGGILISGNMVLDRPQSDFVFGIVNWPIINARSEESILRVYEKAGIPMDQVRLYRIRDEITGVQLYDIVVVNKPAVEVPLAQTAAA